MSRRPIRGHRAATRQSPPAAVPAEDDTRRPGGVGQPPQPRLRVGPSGFDGGITPGLKLAGSADLATAFRDDVIAGLTASPPTLPCKWLYDQRGSQLFEAICDLPEYYPTRTEAAILDRHAPDMAALIGPGALIVEYGSGGSHKTERLFTALFEVAPPVGYVPVDISAEHLAVSAQRLSQRFAPTGDRQGLEVRPLVADFTTAVALPSQPWLAGKPTRTVVYFPGSTIGNFEPRHAQTFLSRIRDQVGPRGGLLIGVDIRKSPALLHAAYNDSAGVTAAFNLNILQRINRELDADFDLTAFAHYAPYNPVLGCIEMHLVSLADQTVRLRRGGQAGVGRPLTLHWRRGDAIHTECSYKYHPRTFAEMATRAGWRVRRVWLGPDEADPLFSVQYLVPQTKP